MGGKILCFFSTLSLFFLLQSSLQAEDLIIYPDPKMVGPQPTAPKDRTLTLSYLLKEFSDLKRNFRLMADSVFVDEVGVDAEYCDLLLHYTQAYYGYAKQAKRDQRILVNRGELDEPRIQIRSIKKKNFFYYVIHAPSAAFDFTKAAASWFFSTALAPVRAVIRPIARPVRDIVHRFFRRINGHKHNMVFLTDKVDSYSEGEKTEDQTNNTVGHAMRFAYSGLRNTQIRSFETAFRPPTGDEFLSEQKKIKKSTDIILKLVWDHRAFPWYYQEKIDLKATCEIQIPHYETLIDQGITTWPYATWFPVVRNGFVSLQRKVFDSETFLRVDYTNTLKAIKKIDEEDIPQLKKAETYLWNQMYILKTQMEVYRGKKGLLLPEHEELYEILVVLLKHPQLQPFEDSEQALKWRFLRSEAWALLTSNAEKMRKAIPMDKAFTELEKLDAGLFTQHVGYFKWGIAIGLISTTLTWAGLTAGDPTFGVFDMLFETIDDRREVIASTLGDEEYRKALLKHLKDQGLMKAEKIDKRESEIALIEKLRKSFQAEMVKVEKWTQNFERRFEYVPLVQSLQEDEFKLKLFNFLQKRFPEQYQAHSADLQAWFSARSAVSHDENKLKELELKLKENAHELFQAAQEILVLRNELFKRVSKGEAISDVAFEFTLRPGLSLNRPQEQ